MSKMTNEEIIKTWKKVESVRTYILEEDKSLSSEEKDALIMGLNKVQNNLSDMLKK